MDFLFFSKMAKLEELEEIDISGNKLKAIPTTVTNCRRMHTVIAHSNCIEVFPEVMQLPEIKVCDLIPYAPSFRSARSIVVSNSFLRLFAPSLDFLSMKTLGPSSSLAHTVESVEEETKRLDWELGKLYSRLSPSLAVWMRLATQPLNSFPSDYLSCSFQGGY